MAVDFSKDELDILHMSSKEEANIDRISEGSGNVFSSVDIFENHWFVHLSKLKPFSLAQSSP